MIKFSDVDRAMMSYNAPMADDGLTLETFDEVNAILSSLHDDGTIEPIDDPSVQIDFWDWADTIGIVDEFVPTNDPFWSTYN